MIQRRSSGKKMRRWPYEQRKCHFCRKALLAGEEYVGFGDQYDKTMHRTCLDNWLRDHPRLPNGESKKVRSAEEIEREFMKIQRRLRAQHRRVKT